MQSRKMINTIVVKLAPMVTSIDLAADIKDVTAKSK
jgi:hypothetical protein